MCDPSSVTRLLGEKIAPLKRVQNRHTSIHCEESSDDFSTFKYILRAAKAIGSHFLLSMVHFFIKVTNEMVKNINSHGSILSLVIEIAKKHVVQLFVVVNNIFNKHI